MPRKKGSNGAAGALEADDLQSWVQQSRSALGAAGIMVTFGRAPRIGGSPGPTWVSMTSSSAHGRLVRSPDGTTKVTAHAKPDSTPLIDERHPHTTIAQLEAVVAALGSRLPTAGRA